MGSRVTPPGRLVRWLLVALATPSGPAMAQEPVGTEVGVQGLALLEDPHFVGGGLFGAWRPGGKTRLAFTLGLGTREDQPTGRGELLVHFLLSPGRVQGAGLYGFGGVAGEVGRRDHGALVLGLGLEGAPGRRSGWVVEAGVGGGVRLSGGWRWRWLSPPGRREP